MMSESGDDANHEASFEIINAHPPETNISTNEPPPAPPSNPNIAPPSVLPAFASLSGSTFAAPSPPPPQPTPSVPHPPTGPPPPPFQPSMAMAPPPPKSPATGGGANPFSIRSAAPTQHHQTHQATTTAFSTAMPPMPPTPTTSANVMMPTAAPPSAEPTPSPFAVGPQQGASGVEISFDNYHGAAMSTGSTEGSTQQQQQQPGGMWGWFQGAVHSSPILSKVAETAKSSVNSVIATLDPQMKDYMTNRGILDVVITLDRDEEIRGMREGISRMFPASNVRPFVVAAGMHAPIQPVGFANALNAAQQKITYIRNSGYIDQTSVVIGNDGFIVESQPDTWLYFDCLVLDDAARQVQLHQFTQPVQVPADIMKLLVEQTPADYQFKEQGYAVSISHAMTLLWSLGPLEWQERMSGISRTESLRQAAVALLYSYRGKL